MIEMTLSSRHRIRNSSPGGLRPSTLPLGHGGSPHTDFYTWMGKKHFCFFQTAETGNRIPNSGVRGSGANHYPRAPALESNKGRTIRYLGGGGGLEFLLLENFFFYVREKTIFFLGDRPPTIFFYVSSKNFFVVCFPYYEGYCLVFLLVNIFFINFDNKLFSTNLFF